MPNWLIENGLAAGLALAYVVLLVRHAVAGQRQTRGLSDYFVGGRRMTGPAIGLSFFATYSSTNSFVGFSGKAYEYGVGWLLLAPCIVLFLLVAWVVVAPRLRELTAALGSVTLPDFIGFRYASSRARVAASLIVVFASVLYMTAVFKGIGTLLEVFLEIPYPVAIGLVLAIVMAYTAAGGFISVVTTDVLQGGLMILAAAVLFGGTVTAAGGLEALEAVRRQPGGRALFEWDTAMPFPVLLGIMVAGAIKFVVEPRQLSRFYALADQREVRRGMWVSLAAFSFSYALLVPIGLYARAIYPGGEMPTDRIVPEMLAGGLVFSSGLGALLVLAMIAAAMSSLDSVLLVVASTFQRDVRSVWRPARSEAAALGETRLAVAGFAVLTALIALDPPGGIVALTAFSGSLYAACFLPAVVLGLHWRRGDGASALASFAAGLSVLLAWPDLPWSDSMHALFPAVLASLGAYVAVALPRPCVPSPHLDRVIGTAG